MERVRTRRRAIATVSEATAPCSPIRTVRVDKYANFARLAAAEREGVDYRIETVSVHGSRLAVIAPHGGGIEPGTSTIARTIANDDISLYLFEGIKVPKGNAVLHITSHHFDEPRCLDLIATTNAVVAIHGCRGPVSRICVGGLDDGLKRLLAAELNREGLPLAADGHEYSATNPLNICNRGVHGRGAQLEISPDLRSDPYAARIAMAVRRAMKAYSNAMRGTGGP